MNTEQIKTVLKTRFLHSLAKQNLKDKYESQLIITTQGGSWQVTSELISFLSIEQLGDTVVLFDFYENPILVNRSELLTNCIDVYTSVTESWLKETQEMKKQR